MGIMRATLSKGSPLVRLDQSSGLADAHLGVYVRLLSKEEGATHCWKKRPQFLYLTRYIKLYFLKFIPYHTFLKVLTSFVKTL
jgi:hypothetical protein